MFAHHFVWYSQKFFGFEITGIPFLATTGVVLFFALSGFLMTGALVRGDQNFLANRILRIYPAFLIAAFLVMGLKIVIWGGLGPVDGVLESLTLLPFGNVSYPLFVEWTLVFEVCFYFLIAFSITWGTIRVSIFILILGIWIIAIVSRSGESQMLNSGFQVFTSAWCIPFVCGSLLGLCSYAKILPPILKPIKRCAGVAVGATCSIVSFYVFQFNSNLYLTTLGLSLCIFLWSIVDMKSNSIFVKVGDYSYGIYLIHVPAMTIPMALMSQNDEFSPAICILLALVISLPLSYFYGLFEYNLYRNLKKRFRFS